jgi:hypothetical protein
MSKDIEARKHIKQFYDTVPKKMFKGERLSPERLDTLYSRLFKDAAEKTKKRVDFVITGKEIEKQKLD